MNANEIGGIVVDCAVKVQRRLGSGLLEAHKNQLLTYLRLSGRKVGYLLNYGEALMKDGMFRIINGKLE